MTKPVIVRAPALRRHPVVELFGPTIQGEGPDAGRPCLFVRFGGCDYRCSWCDSLHAVDPAAVRREARRLTDDDIAADLTRLAPDPDGMLVVLTGGNPVLHELGPLVRTLHSVGMQVSVETQGSRWRDWLSDVDHLVVSPKPPSSGMAGPARLNGTAQFMATATRGNAPLPALCLKVVCFDSADVEFAFDLREQYRNSDGTCLPLYFSAGNEVVEETSVDAVAGRFRWLCEIIAADPRGKDCKVLPQLHVIAWGNDKGR
jgi:7-carboxy-7-deazaguanine synthase